MTTKADTSAERTTVANGDEKLGATLGGREVYLLGEINAERVRLIGSEVIRLWREKPKEPITLFLNSSGGDVDSAIAFCEVVRMKKIPLDAIVCFSADSAALAILCSCRKRSATPSTTFLFHAVYKQIGTRQNQTDFEFHALDLAHATKVYCEIIAKATKKRTSEIAKMMKEGRTLDAREAKKFGLIHKIIKMP